MIQSLSQHENYLTFHFHRHPLQEEPRNRRRSGRRERVSASPLNDTLIASTAAFCLLSSHCFSYREARPYILYNADLFSTVKDKAQHAVILDKATADKLAKDVQSYRLITVSVLVDRLKINGSLARQALADLEEKGQIKKIVGHSKLGIYS